MRVITHVLCLIDDHQLLVEQSRDSDAITEIVKMYNQVALRTCDSSNPDDHMHMVSGETYGSDFKEWLAQLPAADLCRILDRYLSYFPQHAEGDARTEREARRSRHQDSEAEKDARQLRHFVIKFGMVILFMFMILVVAAVVSIMQTNHLLPDNIVFKTIMETATELAKILFTFK